MTLRQRTDCWVDVFERPHFQGRMQRMFGPVDCAGLMPARGKWLAASMIVGPGAAVACLWRPKTGRDEKWLRPKGVIPDLSRLTEGGTLLSIRIMAKQAAVVDSSPADS